MLGDVGEPQLVWGVGGEVAFDEVVVDRRPGTVLTAPPRRVSRLDPLAGAQSPHPSFGDDVAGSGELVGDEPVAELGVVGVDVDRGVDQVRLVQITIVTRSVTSTGYLIGVGLVGGVSAAYMASEAILSADERW